MKLLPCEHCHAPALATREGFLHTAGMISDRKIQYLCKRCGHLQQITDLQFARLPEITHSELRSLSAKGSIDTHYSDIDEDIPPVSPI